MCCKASGALLSTALGQQVVGPLPNTLELQDLLALFYRRANASYLGQQVPIAKTDFENDQDMFDTCCTEVH